MNRSKQPRRGVTLIELVVVVAVLGVLIAVAAPSVRKLLDVQRMRGISAQLTTDIQFVRTEAASRQEIAGITFRYVAGDQSCYTIHTCGATTPDVCTCDCTAPAGSRCPALADAPREIKTVSVPETRGVVVSPTDLSGEPVGGASVMFDPATGGMASYFPIVIVGPPNPPPGFFVGVTRLVAPSEATGAIRTEISSVGRPRTCDGLAACP